MQILNFNQYDKISYFLSEYEFQMNNINETVIIDNIDLSFLQLNDSIIEYVRPDYNLLKNLLFKVSENETHQYKNNNNRDNISSMLFLAAIMIARKKVVGIGNINETEYDASVKSLLTELKLNGVGYDLIDKYIQVIIQTNVLIKKIINTDLFDKSSNKSLPIITSLVNFITKYSFNIQLYLSNIVSITNHINPGDINNINIFNQKLNDVSIKPNPNSIENNISLLTEGVEHMKIPKDMKDKIKKYVTTNSRIENGSIYGLNKDSEYKEYLSKNDIKDECSLGADKDGFFVYTHRAKSKSYPEPTKINLKDIKFINSTS